MMNVKWVMPKLNYFPPSAVIYLSLTSKNTPFLSKEIYIMMYQNS